MSENKNTAILVTGGAGYIGSHVCKHLQALGYLPVTLDNLSTGHCDFVKWGPLIVGDIADKELVCRTIREHQIRAVMHFAASINVGESVMAPEKYFKNNVTGTLALLDAMLEENVRTIVFSSTCAIFGVPETTPITDDAPQNPINPYGESKLFIEKILRCYESAHGLKWVALRYFNAAGADPAALVGERHDPETHLIPLVLAAISGDIPSVKIMGNDYPTPDGTALRDYIHVNDLATAHGLALQHLLKGGQSFVANLGTGQAVSVLEIIRAAETVLGRACPVEQAPRRAGDSPVLVAASSNAQNILGWSPVYTDIKSIIETAWRWHVKTHVGDCGIFK